MPLEQQIPLLLKTISFDRNLKSRVGGRIVLGVVYQQNVRNSSDVKRRFFEILERAGIDRIEDIPIQFVSVDLSSAENLESVIAVRGINFLYVAPIRAFNIDVFVQMAREKQVLTLTGVPEYVEDGLAIGIGSKGEKPCIMINLQAARAVGANFDSRLLNLAKVIE